MGLERSVEAVISLAKVEIDVVGSLAAGGGRPASWGVGVAADIFVAVLSIEGEVFDNGGAQTSKVATQFSRSRGKKEVVKIKKLNERKIKRLPCLKRTV